MITIEILERQNQHLQKKLNEFLNKKATKGGPEERAMKKLFKDIVHRRDVIRYMESSPSESSIKKQLELTDKKIGLIDAKIIEEISNFQHEGLRKEKIADIKKTERYNLLKKQRATLLFILDE